MSRLDFCQYELVDDCYDWKNDHCDECNIFKAYCEGARRAKNSIVRCKDCRWWNEDVFPRAFPEKKTSACECPNIYGLNFRRFTQEDEFCSRGERREE